MEGKTEGKLESKLEIARNAIQMGLDVQSIAELTSLTENEIKDLKNE